MVSEKFTIGPLSDLTVRRGLKIFKGKITYEKTLEVIRNLRSHIGLIMYPTSYNYEATKHYSANKLDGS